MSFADAVLFWSARMAAEVLMFAFAGVMVIGVVCLIDWIRGRK